MDRSCPDFSRLAAVALIALAVGLGGCGDGEDERDVPDASDVVDWSEPAGPAAPQDPGSPDGGGPETPAAVLLRLHVRISTGIGNSGPDFQQDVEAVAAVLWGDATDPEDAAAAKVHTEVCNITGEVTRWLAESEGARAERLQSHPHDVELYDAHVRAMSQGPDAYEGWCAGEGARLLRALKEARYRDLFPPK